MAVEKNPLTVLKDNNFLDKVQDRVHATPSMKQDILQRIEKDKEFLKSCFLMDYSLLLVFFKKPRITESDSFKNRKLSIFIKKGEEGNVF